MKSDETNLRLHDLTRLLKNVALSVRRSISYVKWENVLLIVDFSTLTSFIRTIKTVDLPEQTEHLRYC